MAKSGLIIDVLSKGPREGEDDDPGALPPEGEDAPPAPREDAESIINDIQAQLDRLRSTVSTVQ